MARRVEPVTVADWTRREILGNGSFGQLSVWEERTTHKVIAVKVCIRLDLVFIRRQNCDLNIVPDDDYIIIIIIIIKIINMVMMDARVRRDDKWIEK